MAAAIRQGALALVEPSSEPGLLGRGVRIAEALLFASPAPLSEADIAAALPAGLPIDAVMIALEEQYAPRGVNLVQIGGKWTLRTAPDLAHLFTAVATEPRKLSRAAIETLAIVAYHQPVTRAEIEEVRGVGTSKGTLDLLLQTGWVKMRGRRRTPGRPITFGTTEAFLSHFSLAEIGDLPGLDELKAAGMFDGRLPSGFGVPAPTDDPALTAEEDPLEPDLLVATREARLDEAEPPLDPLDVP